MSSERGLILLNPSRPDPAITAAALVWCEAFDLDDAVAITGLTPLKIVEIIESRSAEIRAEHLRLVASGQIQELLGRTDLAKILAKLRTHIDEMTPGQLLATGSFMHQVSGLQNDRQLRNENKEPKFSVCVVKDNEQVPNQFRGLVLNFSDNSQHKNS